jgi:hypothetical protein
MPHPHEGKLQENKACPHLPLRAVSPAPGTSITAQGSYRKEGRKKLDQACSSCPGSRHGAQVLCTESAEGNNHVGLGRRKDSQQTCRGKLQNICLEKEREPKLPPWFPFMIPDP